MKLHSWAFKWGGAYPAEGGDEEKIFLKFKSYSHKTCIIDMLVYAQNALKLTYCKVESQKFSRSSPRGEERGRGEMGEGCGDWGGSSGVARGGPPPVG